MGTLERALVDLRAENAARLSDLFRAAGADDVRIHSDGEHGVSFGARLRGLIAGLPAGVGLIVLGSGSLPLAMRADAAALVATAGSGLRRATTNNRYSADVVAIGAPATLAAVPIPDLPTDNALPRWLAEGAGYQVDELSRPRLAMDLDSPLDAVLVAAARTGRPASPHGVAAEAVLDRIARLREVAADPRRQLIVAGRTSAATLRWLEAGTRSRTRALVEERGLRALGSPPGSDAGQAPPRSVLGLVLDGRGPDELGSVLAELGDGALVDSRVLLAHRLGAAEAAWPPPEDRFASDLLLAERVRDPWLRALTAAARGATVPVLLGGHSLVGPGARLVLGSRR